MIFVYTGQHTGTWFAIRLLEHFLGEVHLIKAIKHYEAFLHGHPRKWAQRMDAGHFNIPEQVKLSQTHFHVCKTEPEIQRLIDDNKTIIPVRDPMLSLITREKRHPELNPHYPWVTQFDRFVDLAEHPNCFFFPIDLYKSADEKKVLVRNLLDYVGVTDINDVWLNNFVKKWTPVNLTAANNNIQKNLVAPYQNGELDKLHARFKKSYEFLIKNDNIKKFLKTMGYDLPWFKSHKKSFI